MARKKEISDDPFSDSYRPDRIEPRCKKRRPKQYDLMIKPRAVLQKLLKNKRERA